MAFDNNECAPSQLGTTFVNGDLLLGVALNISSTCTPLNPLPSSMSLFNDSSDGLTKIVQPGGLVQNLTYVSGFYVHMNQTSQTSTSNSVNYATKFMNQSCDSLLGGTYRVDLSYTFKGNSGYILTQFSLGGVAVHTSAPYSPASQPMIIIL